MELEGNSIAHRGRKHFIVDMSQAITAALVLIPDSTQPVVVIACLVTLDQAAAIIQVSKRTLERKLADDGLPVPDEPGGNGRAHKWFWSNLRPHLEKLAGRELPAQFPASRIRDP